jgi:hypothetical protein
MIGRWSSRIRADVSAITLGLVAILLISCRPRPLEPISVAVTGVVLRQDRDPREQSPIANAEITISSGAVSVEGRSDTSGFFRLTIQPPGNPPPPLLLKFRHADYLPLDISQAVGPRIVVARMAPVPREMQTPSHPLVTISNVRLRYTIRSVSTMNISSAEKAFEAVNTGNIPCVGESLCSPNGRWKATITSTSFDAGEENQFQNVRVSCIAGPCPFTRIESDDFSQPGRTINVSVLNWSDTATYLVEAEVAKTMASDIVRLSYPAIFGDAMNFTMPATGEGPSVIAEVNGSEIVFPLGPKLNLPWANCTVKNAPEQAKQFLCELKPEYRFR